MIALTVNNLLPLHTPSKHKQLLTARRQSFFSSNPDISLTIQYQEMIFYTKNWSYRMMIKKVSCGQVSPGRGVGLCGPV